MRRKCGICDQLFAPPPGWAMKKTCPACRIVTERISELHGRGDGKVRPEMAKRVRLLTLLAERKQSLFGDAP